MEIFTLLLANIRRKKGSFVSIMILMVIISLSLTAFLSIKESCFSSIDNALTYVDAPTITVMIDTENVSEELIQKINNNELVERMTIVPSVVSGFEYNEKKAGNSYFLQKYDSKFRLLNKNLNGYTEPTKPKSGEIYITQGFITTFECKVGDTLLLSSHSSEPYPVRIAGVVVEPTTGSSSIGWKQLFISNEDYETLYRNDNYEKYSILKIYKASDCSLSDGKFRRQINLDTGVIDLSDGSTTRYESLNYTNLFPEIITSVLMIFLIFLMIIVLIVMNHSIATGIEIDYVNLGVLKAMGFSQLQIRAVFLLQYLLAEVIGAVVGLVLAIPTAMTFTDVFQPITAIPNNHRLAALPSILILLALLAVSAVFVLFGTRKISKISPIRAISGGKNEVYFDNRIKLPITRRCLSASLALRQFTSNKKKYLSTIIITTILVFFMLTINVLGDALNSKTANESMGALYTELGINLKDPENFEEFESKIDEIEKLISSYTTIEKKYYLLSKYISINGENIYCMIYQNPEMAATSKGRSPIYDNEIAISEFIADELELHIGDKVLLSDNDKKAEYLISGYYRSMSDAGRCFAMSLEGAKKLGINYIFYFGYSLSDFKDAEKIAEEINQKYGDLIECAGSEPMVDSLYSVAINAMKTVIYAFSILFALVVITMVCKKSFLQEKTDIGIYKAIGFRLRHLRLQFAVRFLITAAVSSLFGSILSLLFSERLLSAMLHGIGIVSFNVEFVPMSFLFPVGLICVCFFVFSYVVSRRIKKVDIKTLITE